MLTPEQRHLKELTDGLRADIRELAHALNKHTQALESADSSRDASRQQTQDAYIRSVVLEQIQADRKTTEANGKKNKWSSFEKWYFTVQLLLLVATASAFGAALWYASISDIQKNTMLVQTPEISKSADAARDSANTANSALEIAQRAYLSVGEIKTPLGGYGLIDIPLVNYGHVPSAWHKVNLTYRRIRRPEVATPNGITGNFVAQTTLREQIILRVQTITKTDKKTLAPGPEGAYSIIARIPNLRNEDAVGLGTGGEFITLVGSVEYDTGFGKSDTVDVCSQFNPTNRSWSHCGAGGATFDFTETPTEPQPNRTDKKDGKK